MKRLMNIVSFSNEKGDEYFTEMFYFLLDTPPPSSGKLDKQSWHQDPNGMKESGFTMDPEALQNRQDRRVRPINVNGKFVGQVGVLPEVGE